MKMWSGRFRQALDPEFERWQRSFDFDRRLLRYELEASAAHAHALKSAGILSADELIAILQGLEQIGERAVRLAEEMTEEEKKRAKEAAVTAGVGLRSTDAAAETASQFGTAQVDYIYEQAPADLFRALLPKYVSIQIFRSLMESVAAEHAARMTAMDSATNNATDMIDSLTLIMNRARQAKITKEIIEIVSGAAAM